MNYVWLILKLENLDLSQKPNSIMSILRILAHLYQRIGFTFTPEFLGRSFSNPSSF